MTASGTLGIYPRFRAGDADNNPLEAGKLYSYLAGTSTPVALYADAELTTALSNPLVLDASGEATYYYGPFTYKLALHDAQDVPQWVIDPVTGTGGGAASAGIGLGSNTVELRPGASTAQAQVVVFPATVLALGLTVWVEETLGTSQGLTHLGIGTPDLPDCWGVLTQLAAETATHAGMFLGYSGQPIPADGTVTLTAYGGTFDGAGAVYLTGHFATFAPSHALGMSWTPPAPPALSPPAPQPYATEMTPGLIELATPAEVTTGTDALRAVTPQTLTSRQATDTVSGLVELATAFETTTGTDGARAVTPASLAAKVPSGTALSVARYAASGAALESTPALRTSSLGTLSVGSTTPPADTMLTVTSGLNETTARLIADTTSTSNQGSAMTLVRRSSGDMVDNFGVGLSYAIQDTAAVENLLGQLGFRRQGADNNGRLVVRIATGGTLPAASAPGDLAVDPLGNVGVNADVYASGGQRVLALGQGTAPTTGPADAVQLWSANRGGVAGKNSLHLRVEDGTPHVLGDLSGLGTTLTATLGVGSYQALNVKGSLLTVGQSSTQERAQALIASSFVVSTDATRTARLALSVYDATAAREGVRIETSGTAPMLGFYGGAAITKPTVSGSRGGNAALASALTALANLGLLTDSSSA
jgi:hypothetical protein